MLRIFYNIVFKSKLYYTEYDNYKKHQFHTFFN